MILIVSEIETDGGMTAMGDLTEVLHHATLARTTETVATETTTESDCTAPAPTLAVTETSSTMEMTPRALQVVKDAADAKATAKALPAPIVEAPREADEIGAIPRSETVAGARPLPSSRRSRSLHLSLLGCIRAAKRERSRRTEHRHQGQFVPL